MTTLVSLEVSRREKEKAELKQIQKYEMGLKQIESKAGNYISSTSSSKDKYMIEAMNKVQQSDVTFAPTLTDVNGSGMYHLKQRHSKPLPKQIEDKVDAIAKDALNKIVKLKPKEKSFSGSSSRAATTNKTNMSNESKEITYDVILEQLGRKRWEGNPPSQLYRVMKEARIVRGRAV